MKIFEFMKYRKLWFSISGIIIAIGLIFFLINGGLNLGIDFTGGTSIQLEIGSGFDISEVREIMNAYDDEAIVTYAGNDREMALIKTKIPLEVEKQKELVGEFNQKFNITQDNIQFEMIGPAIGNELKRQAVVALLVANLFILVYVSIRFEWRFGVAAIVALIHDVSMMLVVFAVLKIPVNSSFIAAVLTIVGYSINDTIVIFDKIRENIKFAKKDSAESIVNKSLSQTLARSINTSFTTLVTIIILYILGVPALKDFALPLIIGILSGAFSSIFIASPVWLILKNKVKPRQV